MESKAGKSGPVCTVLQPPVLYFEALGYACKLFFEDSYYRVILHGSAFDDTCIPNVYSWHAGGSKNGDNIQLEIDDGRDTCMTFINRSVVVAEDKKVESTSDHLVPTITQCSGTGLFYLELDDRAHELLRTTSSWLLSSVVTIPVEGGMRVVLSGQDLLAGWRADASIRFFLMYRMTRIEGTELEPFVLKSRPGFLLSAWPRSASGWSTRTRNWPPVGVVHEASQQNVYVIPFASSFLSNLTAADEVHLWLLDFSDAEAVLIKSLGSFQRQVFQEFRKMFWERNQCQCQGYLQNLQLKHAFFWTLETTLPNTKWTEKDALSCIVEICKKIISFLELSEFPHYFIPTINMLAFSGLGTASCHESCSSQSYIFHAVMEDCVSASNASGCGNAHRREEDDGQMASVVQLKLTNLFERSASLLFMQLYQRLHGDRGFDQTIKQHLQMLLYLKRDDTDHSELTAEMKTALQAWLTSSLGMKYLIQWKSNPEDAKNADELKKEAEACLTSATELAPYSEACLTALMLFLFSTKQTSKVVERLEKRLLQLVDSSGAVDMNVAARCQALNGITISADFSERLFHQWMHSFNQMDFMFSRLEGEALSSLPGFEETLEFTRCHILGRPPYPLYSVGSGFMMDIILVYSLISEGRREDAVQVLLSLEKRLLERSEGPVGNDKMNVACFFILASSYFSLRNYDEGARLLKLSQRVFRSPRNPAQWRILTLYLNKFKTFLTLGAKVILVVGGVVGAYAAYAFRRTE